MQTWLDVTDRVRFKLMLSAHISMSPWNCSAVLDGQLYTHSRSHRPSTSAFCHSAKVGCTALSTEQFRSSALFCGGPVDLLFAARQSSWPRTESRYFQTSAEDTHFCEILMTKCIQRIRDLFEYALYKFTLYFTLLYRENAQKQTARRTTQEMSKAFKPTDCEKALWLEASKYHYNIN